MSIRLMITAEEREQAERVRRRVELLGRVVAPFAWAFSASLVVLPPLAVGVMATCWWRGSATAGQFATGCGLLSLATLGIYFPPPGICRRERVIVRWAALAAWRAARAVVLAVWEYALKPIIESAYATAMLVFIVALMLLLMTIEVRGINLAIGLPTPPDFPGLTNERDMAHAAMFLFVCLVASTMTSKITWAIARLVHRLVGEIAKVTFDVIRGHGLGDRRDR